MNKPPVLEALETLEWFIQTDETPSAGDQYYLDGLNRGKKAHAHLKQWVEEAPEYIDEAIGSIWTCYAAYKKITKAAAHLQKGIKG